MIEFKRDGESCVSNRRDFWGKIATEDHLVHLYDSEDMFMKLLTNFVEDGLKARECVIVLATQEHLTILEARLKANGVDVFDLKLSDHFIPLHAEKMLDSFLIHEWPDSLLFNYVFSKLMAKAKHRGRKVRAFGEMVVLLWEKGQHAATVHLEHLWDDFCHEEPFCLLCAYPNSIFTEDPEHALSKICSSHSKLITHISDTEIFYKSSRDSVS